MESNNSVSESYSTTSVKDPANHDFDLPLSLPKTQIKKKEEKKKLFVYLFIFILKKNPSTHVHHYNEFFIPRSQRR